MKNILFFILFLFFGTNSLFGTIIYVKPNSNGNGTSWSMAYGNLSDALQNAQTGDEIWVAQGTYFPSSDDASVSFLFKDGVKVYGGFFGTETLLEERADSSGITTILSGVLSDELNSETVLKIHDCLNSLNLIDGFTITGGNLDLTTTGAGGAGVQVLNSTIELKNIIIENNVMSIPDILVNGISMDISIGGAGIYSYESYLQFHNVEVQNNVLTLYDSGNSCCVFKGGAGLLVHGGELSFIKGAIKDNTVITEVSVVNGAGGLFAYTDSLYIESVIISGNKFQKVLSSFYHRGAGIEIANCDDVTFVNNLFYNNDSLQSNSASSAYFYQVTATIINNTFGINIPFNHSPGVGIAGYNSSLTFHNTVFLERFPYQNAGYGFVDYHFNNCISSHWPSENATFNDVISAKMEFMDTEAGNYLPKSCSYVNLGDNIINPSATDLLGNPRVIGDNIDFGAIELQNQWQDIVYVDANTASVTNDGASWETPFKNLTDALKCGCGTDQEILPEQIWVAEGVYIPGPNKEDTFLLNNGQKVYGGFQNGASFLEERDISLETKQTILSGKYAEGIHVAHVVSAIGTYIDTELNGFIVEEGRTYTSGFVSRMSGGGVSVRGQLTLKNLWVRNIVAAGNIPNSSGNTSPHYGGGIYVFREPGDGNFQAGVNIENVKITDNISGNYGGGIAFREGNNSTNNF